MGRNLVRVLASENYDMEKITVLDKNEKNLDYVRRYGVKALHADLAEKQGWYDEFKGKRSGYQPCSSDFVSQYRIILQE